MRILYAQPPVGPESYRERGCVLTAQPPVDSLNSEDQPPVWPKPQSPNHRPGCAHKGENLASYKLLAVRHTLNPTMIPEA